MTSFLRARRALPPARRGLVERLDGLEVDSPVVFCIVRNRGEVKSMVLVVPRLEVVTPVISTGRIMVAAHPPHRRV